MSAVPDTIVYNPHPRAAAATKSRHNLQPINGSDFTPGQVCSISIPCGQRGAFLNPSQSYLKFRVNNLDGTNTLTPDFSAASFIRVLEVVYGSNVLEYVSEYGALYHTLDDAQGDSERNRASGSIMEGNHASTRRVGAAIAVDSSTTFCIPLISGLLGSGQSKYLPVGSLVRNHLKVNLTWASLADAQVGACTSWKISDVEFVADYVTVAADVATEIERLNAGGYRIPLSTFTLNSSTVPGGSSAASVLISGNSRSCKTLLSIFRLQSNAGNAAKKSISNRYNPIGDTGHWQYNVGGSMVPAMPVRSLAESHAELQKAFHAFSAADNHGNCRLADWAATEGSFVIAADLDHFSHKSDVAEAGADVSTSTMYLQCQFGAALGDTVALRVDTFLHSDAVLVIDPQGQAQTIF